MNGDQDDEILFGGEDLEAEEAEPHAEENDKWCILIVDDEEDDRRGGDF
jgi:hypothetical protein